MEELAKIILGGIVAGGPAATISLLLLAVGASVYIIRRELDHQKELKARIDQLEERSDKMQDDHIERLENVIDRYHEGQRSTTESFARINETLIRIMTKLFGN